MQERDVPLSSEGTRVVCQEWDGTVHLRRLVLDRLLLDDECGDTRDFRRVLTATDAFNIIDSEWCPRCFPRDEDTR